MNGKRTPLEIALTIGVGTGILSNVVTVAKEFHKIGEEIAPRTQEYIGIIGSGAVEYGLPVLACLGGLVLGGVAVKATDQYLKNRKVQRIL